MASAREVVREWLGHADRGTLPAVVAAVSVRPARVRAWLRASRRAFVDAERRVTPSARVLDETAAWVTAQSGARMGLVGGVAGLGGLVSIPPEALAGAVSAVRLAQRLAVVYGLDPQTERGTMAVSQALAAGFGVTLPRDGVMGLRVSAMPGVLSTAPLAHDPQAALVTAVVRQSAWWTVKRASRWLPIPVLSSGLGARSATARVATLGETMARTLARLADAAQHSGDVVDAVEIGGG